MLEQLLLASSSSASVVVRSSVWLRPVVVLGAEGVDQLEVAGPLARPAPRAGRRPPRRSIVPGVGLLLAVAAAVRRRCRGARIRNGSVSPWPTSVARITANVRKITRSRSGKSTGRAQRGGERDDAAHPGPRDDARRSAAPGTARARGSGAERRAGRRCREDPDDPGHDRRRGDRDGQAEQLPGRVPAEARSTAGSCSPIRMNTAPLMRNSRICQAAVPARRTDELMLARRVAPDPDPGGDRREHARQAELLRRQVGRDRREERQHDREHRVVDPPQRPGEDQPRPAGRTRPRRRRRRRT